MKKRITIIYTIFASAVMLFALLFLGYNLHKEYKQGISRTASVFANTVFDLRQELDNTDETKRNFSKRISAAVGDFKDYSFYELQKNGNIVYAFPANSSQEQTKSNFTKNFSTMIEIDDNTKYLLTCNIYLLRPSSIYYFSKISFFIILVITLITFALIIFTTYNIKKKEDVLDFDFDEADEEKLANNNLDDFGNMPELENENVVNNGDDKQENDTVVDNVETNIEHETTENNFVNNSSNSIDSLNGIDDKDSIKDNVIEDISDDYDDIETKQNCEDDNFGDISLDFEDSDFQDEDNNTENETSDKASDEKDESYEIEEDNKNHDEIENEDNIPDSHSGLEPEPEPEGLFSHVTGLGWESYLLTRLDNELERSVASEMDISLFVIQISNITRDCEIMKKICDYIVNQFQFRDLIFEYKDDCIVAIKNSTTLEEALTFADKIHAEISKMLEGTDSNCYIGISTRTVRIISGERFLKEAEEALCHAREDNECSIIAFRADIEKYRKYLETKLDA